MEEKSQNNIIRITQKIIDSDNVLIALSKNPSADELAAAIGLSIYLDKAGKHATAIYSGRTPSVIEFLEPERTLEANTDSLRDFIIAINKDKADHLRYKIEGDYVRVYITPYKTKISESDLEFSHGDFNIGLIIALNVSKTSDLDSALTTHGRILNDAEVINISTSESGDFGNEQWFDPGSSSVSEMVASLSFEIEKEMEVELDESIVTAYLTGIFVATERFSNERTQPETMNVSAKLMSYGANQKLISEYLKKAELTKASPAKIDERSAEAVDNESNQDDATLMKIPKSNDDNDQVVLPENKISKQDEAVTGPDDALKADNVAVSDNNAAIQKNNNFVVPMKKGVELTPGVEDGFGVPTLDLDANSKLASSGQNISTGLNNDLAIASSDGTPDVQNDKKIEPEIGNNSSSVRDESFNSETLPLVNQKEKTIDSGEGFFEDNLNRKTSLDQLSPDFEEVPAPEFEEKTKSNVSGDTKNTFSLQTNKIINDSSVDNNVLNELKNIPDKSSQIKTSAPLTDYTPLGHDYSEDASSHGYVGSNPALNAAPGVEDDVEANNIPSIDYSNLSNDTTEPSAQNKEDDFELGGEYEIEHEEPKFGEDANKKEDFSRDDGMTLEPKPEMPLPNDQVLPPPPPPASVDFSNVGIPKVRDTVRADFSEDGLPKVTEEASIDDSVSSTISDNIQSQQASQPSSDPGSFRIPGM